MDIPEPEIAIELLKWIKAVPYILVHYVPGFITIATYRYLRNGNKRMSEMTHFGACICLSYLLNFIPWLCFEESPRYLWGIVSTVIGIVLATAVYFIRKAPKISWLLARYTETALDDCVLDGCRLYSTNRQVIVYTNDAIIEGRVQLYNQEENDNWLALDRVIYTSNDNSRKEKWNDNKTEYERYLIPFEEIKIMRLKYDENIKGDKNMIPWNTDSAKKENDNARKWFKQKKPRIRKGKK